jgi:hypothetical protein
VVAERTGWIPSTAGMRKTGSSAVVVPPGVTAGRSNDARFEGALGVTSPACGFAGERSLRVGVDEGDGAGEVSFFLKKRPNSFFAPPLPSGVAATPGTCVPSSAGSAALAWPDEERDKRDAAGERSGVTWPADDIEMVGARRVDGLSTWGWPPWPCTSVGSRTARPITSRPRL